MRSKPSCEAMRPKRKRERKTMPPLDQATRDEIREIAASLEEDLERARQRDNMWDRMQAIQSALAVLLHTLSEEPKP